MSSTSIRMGASLLGLLLCLQNSMATDMRFYIGTRTDHSTSQGIYACTLNAETGALGPVTLAGTAKNPEFIAISHDGKFVYAASNTQGAHAALAFAVQPDHSLKALNQQPSGGDSVCHVSLDRSGKFVFVANYSGGNVAAFPIQPDGSLGAQSGFVQFTGSGPNANRQKAAYAHSIYADPENKHVYVCDLGSDRVWICDFDSTTGKLSPSNPPALVSPPGSGPRHLAFGRDGGFVYVADELTQTVDVLKRDPATGGLSLGQTLLDLPPGTSQEGVTTAEIFVHPTGKWLYVSVRGTNTLSTFAIADEGRLSLIQTVPALVKSPRNFALDPSGRWLIAAGEKSDSLQVFQIDAGSGQLVATSNTAQVPFPNCVAFTP